MSSCSCKKSITKPTKTTKPTGKLDGKQWNPYCTCDLRKCPGIKKSDIGIFEFSFQINCG